MKKLFLAALIWGSALSFDATAQSKITASELPQYIIITANNNATIGGIGLSIDKKNSKYAAQFERLEKQLESKKEGDGVRNLNDLLNAMHELGFEYINAFVSGSFDNGTKEYSTAKNRNNIVFKKK